MAQKMSPRLRVTYNLFALSNTSSINSLGRRSKKDSIAISVVA